ncbi:hypothetical protein [Pimelobacter simplex]|uniref:hypothetical protein n=1 Tax=Nocardioides simplex TaxID=2045 RepID=UPI000535F322|nr:hypothetical protein [Pimelobacter simplex]GEB14307.1 hypothetical protein NSI01_26220 [Pimelobacter simplex]
MSQPAGRLTPEKPVKSVMVKGLLASSALAPSGAFFGSWTVSLSTATLLSLRTPRAIAESAPGL